MSDTELTRERATYTRSDGSEAVIGEMKYPHLRSALAKLEREQPERVREIKAMRAEVAARDEVFAREQEHERARND
jgi:hypothetical protein